MSRRDPIEELLECLHSHEPATCVVGNLRCCDTIDALVALKARAQKAEARAERLAALWRARVLLNVAAPDPDVSDTVYDELLDRFAAAYAATADAATAAATAAADDAEDAAYADADAAAAACAAARSESLARSADIVRRHFPAPPRIGSTR